MTEFKIEKGVPIPEKVSGGVSKYPFSEMAVGDSLFAPGEAGARMRTAAYEFARRHGLRFMARTVENEVRIWRVE